MNFDKNSCEDVSNTREIQEDSEFIVVTEANKEDIMEFSLLHLEVLSKEISIRQNQNIQLGKMLSRYDDPKLKAQGKTLLIESTTLGRRYKDCKKAIAKLSETNPSIAEVAVLFRNLDQF